ncbi:MAG: hypothetical protein RMK81_06910 [Geminicoccaceae bacterium]|nr:hypothetical protein [Geminicoccaceae bacterium]
MRWFEAVAGRLVLVSAAIVVGFALHPRPLHAQGGVDRCAPPAFARTEENTSERAKFRWHSDVEHRHATACRYEQQIEYRVFNEHDDASFYFTWEKAGLKVNRSKPVPPKDSRVNVLTVPPGINTTVEYGVPLYYGSKPGTSVKTDVYVLGTGRLSPTTEASRFNLFSLIVGTGETETGQLEKVVLEATSFTDLKDAVGWVSFRTTGPVRSVAFSGLRDAPFVNKEEAVTYYSRLRDSLGSMSLSVEVVGPNDVGFQPHDNSAYGWIEKAEFLKIKIPRSRPESITIPLPRADEHATSGKLFTVLLDAKGNPAGTGFVSVVFAPAPKR